MERPGSQGLLFQTDLVDGPQSAIPGSHGEIADGQ